MTKVIRDLNAWRALRASLPSTLSVGLVATMGNLHEGHLSLCKQSQLENEITIMTLFVNRMQFDVANDFLKYPKTLDADLKMLEDAGVDYCLLPTEAQLYADRYHYRVDEQVYTKQLEGAARPGHYTGVLTIVMKLLQLTKPTRAYFGEKDYQQYELIKGMVDAFFMDIDVIVCPTVRESSGLAMSSRNNRLTAEEKKEAARFACIFRQIDKSLEAIQAELEAAQIRVDYLQTWNARRFVAVFIGDVRLIDNYAIGVNTPSVIATPRLHLGSQ